jgi:hypothetical protein
MQDDVINTRTIRIGDPACSDSVGYPMGLWPGILRVFVFDACWGIITYHQNTHMFPTVVIGIGWRRRFFTIG